MKAFGTTLQTLGVCALVATLTGCGGRSLSPFSPTASSVSKTSAVNYKVLYSFHGRDGAEPLASLIDVDGTLYGTTSQGGARNHGTVFSISPSGKERVLHSFGPMDHDGTYPGAALLDAKGTLYGTTELGNKENTGTVFSITTSGEEHVLYSFGEFGPSGMAPSARLIDVDGTLYSTTNFGGKGNLGTVFSISTSGKESTLHSFGHPYRSDGQIPAAALTVVNGILYGTTVEGGVHGRGNSCSGPCPGDGTVFSISAAGKVHVLHSFGSGSDGTGPQAALTNVKGTLYGTTLSGGAYVPPYGAGTIFSIDTAGTEKVVYSFKGGSDGGIPAADLIDVKGKLYGTTEGAGAYGPYGTVFSIDTDGSAKQALHSFGASHDGTNPMAGLLNVNGTLYGTTSSGGFYGKGTIFAITP